MILQELRDKSPDADVDCTFDFRPWIASLGQGIQLTAVSFASHPTGLTIKDKTFNADGLVSARIAGGDSGVAYTVTCTATATGNRVEVLSARMLVTLT